MNRRGGGGLNVPIFGAMDYYIVLLRIKNDHELSTFANIGSFPTPSRIIDFDGVESQLAISFFSAFPPGPPPPGPPRYTRKGCVVQFADD